jgi:putative pyruvate formate lyase activating enzyme
MFFRIFTRDEKAEEALPNYFAILADKRTAGYLIAKKTEVENGLSGTTEELQKCHKAAITALRSERIEPEQVERMKRPKVSLLDLKLELARRFFKACNYCERLCGTDRTEKAGVCGVTESRVSSEFLHYGEEPELVPSYTIFFSGCTFKCVFCQNWDISQHPDAGVRISAESMAKMVERQVGRAKNTNWVGGDPTSNLKYILEVLTLCKGNIPQVWNSNMYLTESTMGILDGVIDVYLTDFKYGPDDCGKRLSKVDRYWDVITRNHKLANEQTEIIIRHLVLPNHLECCTKPILEWIAANLECSRVRVNIMDQYHPDHKAYEHDDLTRPLESSEFDEAVSYGRDLGLNIVT